MREAGRSYVQTFDLTKGAIEAAEALPGPVVLGPPQLTPDGRTLFVSSGLARTSAQRTWDELSRLDVSSFKMSTVHASPSGENGFVAAFAGVSELSAVRIGNGEEGFIETWPVYATLDMSRWRFPGVAVAAARLATTNCVAVLCRPASRSGAVLRIVDTVDANTPVEEVPVEDEHLFDPAPTGLAISADGACAFVLLSGHAVDRPSGEPLSWLHAVRISTPHVQAPSIEIPGVAQASEIPLMTVDSASCWIATRTQGSGFAHVVRVALGAGGLMKEAAVDLTNVMNPLRMAIEPTGRRLAVAVDRTLEVWHGNERGEVRHTYGQPPAALSWNNNGLCIGAGRFVHLVNPDTAQPMQSVALQSGWVVYVAMIEDALSPVGGSLPSTLPGEILFHTEAAGQEVKAFRVGEDDPRGSPWHVSFEREKMPWLVIHPTQGIAPSVIYMGVDPGRCAPGDFDGSLLTVVTDRPAQTRVIDMRVLPLARSDLRRILWIWPDESRGVSFRDPPDPRGLRELGEILAAPPHLFAHCETVVPASESLDPFTVVVLDTSAALRGAVTRQALLEYVLHGGSLLLIGRCLPENDPEALAAWLQPVGVEINTRARLDGLFPSALDTHVGRYWHDVRLSDGCAIYTDDSAAIAVPVNGEARQAALILRSYGRGRIAILAAATPLLSASLREPERRRFAEDLFGWLASAVVDANEQDMDGDGIPDAIEDKNGNGLVDPGETDYLDTDADGDGLPDGMEDSNLNGVVDDGETSPLNPDSNGNGVCDGADPAPLPMEGAPIVTGVNPAQCPAEGGIPAVISGRNLPPDAAVWFGEAPVQWTRVLRGSGILVEVPPSKVSGGGDVPVRVRGEASGLEAVLPSAFHYSPLSHVTLGLQGSLVTKKDGSYSGTVSILLDTPEGVKVNQVVLLLRAMPADGLAWEEQPPAGASEAHERLVIRTTKSGDLLVAALADRPGEVLRGKLGQFAWHVTPPDGTAGPLRFTIEQPRVMSFTARSLDVATRAATVGFPE